MVVTVKLPAVPAVKVGVVGRGERGCLVDGEGEGLAGVRGWSPLAAVMVSG